MAAALLSLCACDAPSRPPSGPAAKPEAVGDSGYLAPPSIRGVRRESSQVALLGQAAPGASVRLATPAGEARTAQADARGAWSLVLPNAGEARIFGLSMNLAGRVAQAQGYVLVTPAGEVAQLRAGAGAAVLAAGQATRLTAIDFDQGGGAVVSGVAQPDAPLALEIDGRPSATGRADASGRLTLALTQPLRQGSHSFALTGDTGGRTVEVGVTPAAPLAGQPYRAINTPYGLRVDWITPGGGVQSTLLLN
ncbi:hypothetical protein [Phenylobacterium sp.]|uniref:hypothetical protein n=1 Tax=Phenylobacterium sp. TaxID=1871053 RepID=UPI00273337BD|nr:hypothetical protein [Phenylobacterium sp.]MDP3660834.1 hypothetical protein [Phenylobacterium sp.]